MTPRRVINSLCQSSSVCSRVCLVRQMLCTNSQMSMLLYDIYIGLRRRLAVHSNHEYGPCWRLQHGRWCNRLTVFMVSCYCAQAFEAGHREFPFRNSGNSRESTVPEIPGANSRGFLRFSKNVIYSGFPVALVWRLALTYGPWARVLSACRAYVNRLLHKIARFAHAYRRPHYLRR